MKKINTYHMIAIILMLVFSACEKEGTVVLPKIKALQPFEMSGFIVGDTLEQYFDGIKVRDYYGRVSLGVVKPSIAFQNEVTTMQFKNKRTGQKVYEQTFNITAANNIVPKFYFDGNTLVNHYSYPSPQGADYLINFYYDAPKGSAGVDVGIDVLEYYYNANNELVVVNTTSFPIANNIQMGTWTDFLKISPPPLVTATQAGTDLYPIVVLRDAKTKQYLINNDRDNSTLQIEIPDQWTSSAKVQSIYMAKKVAPTRITYLETNDLVQLFP